MRLSSEAARHCRLVADRYVRATGHREYEAADVVAWATARGELELSPEEMRALLTARMSEALRTDTTTDGQGRAVRLRHCVEVRDESEETPRQRTLWAHVDDAADEFLYQALLLRRRRIKADVAALRADLDYVNARRAARGVPPIQMDLSDFTSP